MNLLKNIFKSTPQEDLASVPSGEFVLVRPPNSPSGERESIFSDATATIRPTSTPFNYQLVIERSSSTEKHDTQTDSDDDSVQLDDDYVFLIDPEIRLTLNYRTNPETHASEAVISWKDPSTDFSDQFEFIANVNRLPPGTISDFEHSAMVCQYERTYQRSGKDVPNSVLDEFRFPSREVVIIDADADVNSSEEKNPDIGGSAVESVPSAPSTPIKPAQSPDSSPGRTIVLPVPPKKAGDEISVSVAQLHLYDPESGEFALQAPKAYAKILDLGNYVYWFEVWSSDKQWIGIQLSTEMSPCFNFEHLSFIFNMFTDTDAFSWLLRFPTGDGLTDFQEHLMTALWETINRTKMVVEQSKSDMDYFVDAFDEMVIDETGPAEEEQLDESDEEEEPEQYKESYDPDEDFDDVSNDFEGEGKNSLLAVGTNVNRSFVVRGDKIGVFKHGRRSKLEFATTIDKISTPKGKSFSPSKVMLHTRDRNIVLQNPTDPGKLYSMDLEVGKVVDEWEVDPNGDKKGLTAFNPVSKFATAEGESTLLGTTSKSLFRIDPRLAGVKMVQENAKKYATNNKFSAMSTTENGFIAVASEKGDIRLYDRLGVNAKTALPALGEPITGLDTSADGRWLLATCRTYLLLVDTKITDGPNEGKLGFEKSFSKDKKPRPIRLQLSPEHVAQMLFETKLPLNFTTARFNAGFDAKETTIVSSSGKFVITWSLSKILRGFKNSYTIKRYEDTVTADNFQFGSDKNVIVAMTNDVDMVNRKAFAAPTRESIATP
ncbi:hypothetical protein CANCADRAFT_12932, partial [Tortispora caseinolytica NRRL Y-17796]